MINRAGNKEKAKRVLNENGNLSGMVGMEILYRVIAAITSVLLGAMIAGGIGVRVGGCVGTVQAVWSGGNHHCLCADYSDCNARRCYRRWSSCRAV